MPITVTEEASHFRSRERSPESDPGANRATADNALPYSGRSTSTISGYGGGWHSPFLVAICLDDRFGWSPIRDETNLIVREYRPERFAELEDWSAVDLVILELSGANPVVEVDRIVTLKTRLPHARIVGLCSGAIANSVVLRYGRAGLDDLRVWVRGAISEVIARERALGTSRQSMLQIEAVVGELVDQFGRAVIAYCVENARHRITVIDVARHFGIHRKTLVDRCRASGLMAPHSVIAWARLINAIQLADKPDASLERVALALEFGSAAALRRTFLHYVGKPAHVILMHGGFAAAIREFASALASVRNHQLLTVGETD